MKLLRPKRQILVRDLLIYFIVCILFTLLFSFKVGNDYLVNHGSKFMKDLKSSTFSSSRFPRFDERAYIERDVSFTNSMSTFPWSHFRYFVELADIEGVQHYSSILFSKLMQFVKKLPPVPLNESCHPPKLAVPQTCICNKLKRPRKVGILLQFGSDVDALEVHLHELNDVVDKFFIIESIMSHSRYLKSKPLIWESLKSDQRFERFVPKIVHFVLDDADLSEKNASKFAREVLQEKFRWTKFLEWNSNVNYFTSEDLLGFGDVDEIPHRNNIFYLKNCHFNTYPVDIGIWFPFPYINSMFQSDWPVTNQSYTLGDPTFWTFENASKYFLQNGTAPNRLRGRAGPFLLGGMHMSRYAYPPFLMSKYMTASEAGDQSLLKIISVGELYGSNRTKEAERLLNQIPPYFKRRIKNISLLKKTNQTDVDAIVKIPWLIQCNPGRYPSLNEGGYDLRLGR